MELLRCILLDLIRDRDDPGSSYPIELFEFNLTYQFTGFQIDLTGMPARGIG